MQRKLREAVADHELEPGELLPGMNAARGERLRARGVPEDQLKLIREQIAAPHAEHTRDGWTVVFENDHRASVHVVLLGSSEAAE